MLPIDDEKKYKQVINLLKNLPKVKTPANFESELNRRIRFNEPLKIKESWFDKIFSPKLIPTAALAVTTVIILFLLRGNFSDVEDPFQIIPKLREEFINESRVSNNKQKASEDLLVNKSTESKNEDSNFISSYSKESISLEKISVSTINYSPDETIVLKGGLDFKVLRMGEEELKQIKMLREKLGRSEKSIQNN